MSFQDFRNISSDGTGIENVSSIFASIRFLPEVPLMFKIANFLNDWERERHAVKLDNESVFPRITMNSVEPNPISQIGVFD